MRALPLLTLLLPLLTSCERSPTGGGPVETTLAFELRRGEGGPWEAFSARGQQPAGTSFSTPGPWVFTGQNGSSVVLHAHHQADGGWRSFHVVLTLLPEHATVRLGSAAAGTCPDPDGRPCTFATLRIESAGGGTEVCTVTGGELVRTRATDSRVSGRFSGSGTCTGGAAARPFTLRDGTFDVALPPPAPGPG